MPRLLRAVPAIDSDIQLRSQPPFWIANAFVCLALPEDHPFWTDTETNGVWEEMKDREVRTTVLDGPGIVVDKPQGHRNYGIRDGEGPDEERESVPQYVFPDCP